MWRGRVERPAVWPVAQRGVLRAAWLEVLLVAWLAARRVAWLVVLQKPLHLLRRFSALAHHESLLEAAFGRSATSAPA